MKNADEVKKLRDEALARLQQVERQLVQLGALRQQLIGTIQAHTVSLDEAPPQNRAERRRAKAVAKSAAKKKR